MAAVAPAPHQTMNALPRRGQGSVGAASAPQKYSTLLDAVLDRGCCAAEDGREAAAAGPASHAAQRPRPPQRPSTNDGSYPRSLSAGSGGRRRAGRRDSHSSRSPDRAGRAEPPVLPHLRFHPLPPSASMAECPSLKEFFALFLADDAPHSFRLFHEANGDEVVRTTPWKKAECEYGRQRRGPITRTVEFKTKIAPGASSNPLAPSDHSTAATVPLMVIVTQTLIRHSATRWTLRCEFAFDFLAQSKLGTGLGTGLSQFLMSNVVKGSNVNVAITLRECDDGVGAGPSDAHRGSADSGRSHVRRSKSDSSAVPYPGCTLPPCQEEADAQPLGFFSCLTHPLLLPQAGLCCAATDCGVQNGTDRGNAPNTSVEEPAEIGASLLSAINAKNAPMDDDGDHSMDRSLVARPFLCGRSHFESLARPFGGASLAKKTPAPHVAGKRWPGQEDVLSYGAASGALKMKAVPSFELSRAPSATSMRNMILNKCGEDTTIDDDGPSRAERSGSGRGSSPSASPQGLSMCIEMELSGPAPSGPGSAASSLSGSLSRSASISNIDDKVRRGLKKRIARSWVTWAESWCMRLWEEEATEIRTSGKRRNIPNGGSLRQKKNVRPTVRRIGEPARPAPPRNVWQPLEVGRKRSGRKEKWIPVESEGEVGVEVACTMPAPKPRRRSSLLSKSSNEEEPTKSQQETSGKQSKVKRRLLKSLSAAT